MNWLSGQTAAVTGGLGLIGSFVCEELLLRGVRVIIVDDESKGGWTYCAHLREQVEIRKGSLENASFAKESLEGASAVFHLASRTCGVGFSSKNHLELFEQNNRVTFNTLSAVATHRPLHLMVTSSSCVYSDQSPSPMNDEEPWDGEPELVNRGYGWAKRILEEMAHAVCSETGVGLTIVRPVNVYGERYHWMGDSSQALPMLTNRILDNENPLVIWGSGNQRRSYVHAADCARIMVNLVNRRWTDGPVNIGSEETISLPEAVALIASAAGRHLELSFDTSKPEGRLIKAASSRRLRHALDLSSADPLWSVSPDVGLARMIDWHGKTFKKHTGSNPGQG